MILLPITIAKSAPTGIAAFTLKFAGKLFVMFSFKINAPNIMANIPARSGKKPPPGPFLTHKPYVNDDIDQYTPSKINAIEIPFLKTSPHFYFTKY